MVRYNMMKKFAAARIRTGVVAATTRSTDLYTTAARMLLARTVEYKYRAR